MPISHKSHSQHQLLRWCSIVPGCSADSVIFPQGPRQSKVWESEKEKTLVLSPPPFLDLLSLEEIKRLYVIAKCRKFTKYEDDLVTRQYATPTGRETFTFPSYVISNLGQARKSLEALVNGHPYVASEILHKDTHCLVRLTIEEAMRHTNVIPAKVLC